MFKAMGLNTDSFIPSGKTSLQTYFHHFLPQQQVLLVHNVYTTEEDIAFIHETGNKVFDVVAVAERLRHRRTRRRHDGKTLLRHEFRAGHVPRVRQDEHLPVVELTQQVGVCLEVGHGTTPFAE